MSLCQLFRQKDIKELRTKKVIGLSGTHLMPSHQMLHNRRYTSEWWVIYRGGRRVVCPLQVTASCLWACNRQDTPEPKDSECYFFVENLWRRWRRVQTTMPTPTLCQKYCMTGDSSKHIIYDAACHVKSLKWPTTNGSLLWQSGWKTQIVQ